MSEENNIYTTLPQTPMMTVELKQKLLSYLKGRREQWFTAIELSEVVGLKELDKTKPTIRAAAKELLSEGHPVASSKKGFMYTDRDEVLEKFRDQMLHRIKAMERTVRHIDLLIGKPVVPEKPLEDYYLEPRDGSCTCSPQGVHIPVPDKEQLLVCLWCKKKLK